MDRDGHLDVVTADLDNVLSFFHGDGTRSGFFRTELPTGQTIIGNGLAVDDFDRDGRMDVAVTSAEAVHVFRGQGSRRYQHAQILARPAGVNMLVAGDLDNDSLPDLLTANPLPTGSISIFKNRRSHFDEGRTIAIRYSTDCLSVGRLDEDDWLDIAVGGGLGPAGRVAVFRGPTIGDSLSYPTPGTVGSILIADLDGDGRNDLIAAGGQNEGPRFGSTASLTVWLGSPTGTLGEPRRTSLVGTLPSGSALHDLDGDGILDVAVADFLGTEVEVLHGDGRGGFSPSLRLETGADTRALGIADLDGDGLADICAGSYGGLVIFFGEP